MALPRDRPCWPTTIGAPSISSVPSPHLAFSVSHHSLFSSKSPMMSFALQRCSSGHHFLHLTTPQFAKGPHRNLHPSASRISPLRSLQKDLTATYRLYQPQAIKQSGHKYNGERGHQTQRPQSRKTPTVLLYVEIPQLAATGHDSLCTSTHLRCEARQQLRDDIQAPLRGRQQHLDHVLQMNKQHPQLSAARQAQISN